jgi:DNA anti-recombination protein RmuC
MTSLDFLYIALGGGFLILVVFISILILYATFLLRDVDKITEDLREITDDMHKVSDRIKNTVFEPIKTITEMTAGFGFISEIVEKIKARYAEHMEEGEETEIKKERDSKKEDSKGRNGFMIKKLKK